MNWNLEYTKKAFKTLEKLDQKTKKEIFKYLQTKVIKDPRSFGKSLTGSLKGFWRYRVGDYRLICEINDNELIVVLVKIGHRKDVYEL